MADAPKSYKDPYYAQLSAKVEKELDLPPGLLHSIVTKGERTNADQVSPAGAKTVFQIIPSTRDLFLKKYGIDAYLSAENAAKVSGLHVKESLQRNNGSVPAAVAEYHAGPNRKLHGKKTSAYVARVTGQPSTYEQAVKRAEADNNPEGSIADRIAAYNAGKLPPEQAQKLEADVAAGNIMLPRGVKLKESSATVLPQSIVDAYQSGRMDAQAKAELERDLKSGKIKMPQQKQSNAIDIPVEIQQAYASGKMDDLAASQLEDHISRGLVKDFRTKAMTQARTQSKVSNLGLLGGIKEQITGSMRETQETKTLPEWTSMPELNKLDLAGLKTAAGTFFANDPNEVAKIIIANNPNIKIRQDEKGNYIFRSAVDNKEYAYPPGLSIGDIPKAIGQTLAFAGTGSGGLVRQAATSAGVQAGMETVQAGTGGTFDTDQVLMAGAAPVVFEGGKRVITQGVLPAVKRTATALRPQAAQTTQAIKQAPIQQAATAPVVQQAADNVAPVVQAADNVPVQQAVQVADNVPVQPNLMTGEQLATTTKKAVDGVFGKTKATAVLAEQAAPDPKVVAAANRIGVAEYLQPDHVTTNQAFRELSQAVKSVPGSQARQVEMQNLTVVGQKADDLITKIGGTTDVSTLSQSVKDELAQTVEALTKQADDAYESLRRNISEKTRGAADGTLNFLNQRAVNRDGVKNLSPIEKMVISKLSPKKMSDGSVKYPTYALIDDVRRDVGAAARQAGEFANADTGLAKQLYKLLDNDQFKIAEAAGQGAEYKVAASIAKAYKGFQDDMTALFGKQLDQSLVGKLESATVALSKGDSQKLAKIIKVIPQPMRERVVASSLNTAFGKATQNGSLNFNTFANWYEGLLQNKQSYSTLMSNLPKDARKQLSDWYRVSNSIRKATRERITTGRIQAVQQQLQDADTLVANIYSVAKRAAVGIPLEAATTSVGMPGAGIASGLTAALTKGRPNILKAADTLITSPEFVKMASEVAKNKTPSPQAVKVVVNSKKFNDFANSIKLPKNVKIREEWLRSTFNAAQSQSQVQENQPEL